YDFEPAEGSVVAGGAGQLGRDALACQVRLLNGLWGKFLQARFRFSSRWSVYARIERRTELRRQLTVVLTGVLARPSGDLGGEQVHDRAILVCGPYASVESQEAGAGAFFAAEATGAVEQARCEPLEPHRHFAQLAAKVIHDSVNHAAADERLAHHGGCRP